MTDPFYQQLKTVAEELQMGMVCYLHRQTGEVVSFPDPQQFPDTSAWQTEVDLVATESDSFIAIEPMSSRESFAIMEQFVDQLPANFQQPLRDALARPKPFRQFKEVVDGLGHYRQEWFVFRDAKTIEWLWEQLRAKL